MSTTRKLASDPRRTRRAAKSGADKTAASIEVLNRQRQRAIHRAQVAHLARAVLDLIGQPDAAATITFIRDQAMRRLNRDYRGIDEPTDVLSFAYHENGGQAADEHGVYHLGDVVISVETAAAYARQLGLTFDHEIQTLVIHGVLHLAGYDHETDHGEMRRLERRLRRELIASRQ